MVSRRTDQEDGKKLPQIAPKTSEVAIYNPPCSVFGKKNTRGSSKKPNQSPEQEHHRREWHRQSEEKEEPGQR
jgi:hypothetical protein